MLHNKSHLTSKQIHQPPALCHRFLNFLKTKCHQQASLTISLNSRSVLSGCTSTVQALPLISSTVMFIALVARSKSQLEPKRIAARIPHWMHSLPANQKFFCELTITVWNPVSGLTVGQNTSQHLAASISLHGVSTWSYKWKKTKNKYNQQQFYRLGRSSFEIISGQRLQFGKRRL